MLGERSDLSVSPQGPGWQAAVAAALGVTSIRQVSMNAAKMRRMFDDPINHGRLRISHMVGAVLSVATQRILQ